MEGKGRKKKRTKQARKKTIYNLFVIKINGVKPLLGRWSSCISYIFLLLSTIKNSEQCIHNTNKKVNF